MKKDYYTVNEIAELWGLTPRWVRAMCSEGKILGTVQFGRSWAIHKDAVKPTDGRVTTGEYKNLRNKSDNK